jgi:hypothetical protein
MPGESAPVKKFREAAKKARTLPSADVSGQGSSVSLQASVSAVAVLEFVRQNTPGR